jgi:hypothetical protein
MPTLRRLLAWPILVVLLSLPVATNSANAAPVDPNAVATVDAGLGPCTADFTINDESGKPVYAANIRVHITYGFGGFHKFDLQVGTNADGKARFIGLPEHPKQGLFFHAAEGDRQGDAFDNPADNCKAQFTVVLRKKQ